MRLLLLLLILPVYSLAAIEPGRVWNCTLPVTLTGDSGHFFTHGRDSFNGEGEMRCLTKDASPYTRRMRVTFNAFGIGVGADASTSLKIVIRLRTHAEPMNYQFRQFVTDLDKNEKVMWSLRSQLNSGTAQFQHIQGEDVFPSLEKGTLYIRGSVD